MNKYLNIMVISFFSILTIYYKIGLVLYIPIVVFFVINNNKNIYFILPSSFVALYLFYKEGINIYLIFMISLILFLFLLKRYNSFILIVSYIFLTSLTSVVVDKINIGMNETIIYLLFALISVALYSYFVYNVEGALVNQNQYRNFAYIEVIAGIIAVVGASNYQLYDVNLGLALSIFIGMYLSSNENYAHSLFFGLLSLTVLMFYFDIDQAIIIPFICSLYIFPKLYGPITVIMFSLIGLITEIKFFSPATLEMTIIISIIFELFRFALVGFNNNQEGIIKGVYSKTIENVNNEVIGFASFLDMFAKEFTTPKEYTEKLSEGINNLTHYYCEACYVRKECYSKNKGKLYTYFKNLILYARRIDRDFEDQDAAQFFKNCPYTVEMRKSSMLISEKLNIESSSNKLNTLVAQINGISNVLRQYTVDKSLKTEMDYDIFYKIKKGLTDYGFNICYYEVKKIYHNDFLIEVGLRGHNYNDCKQVVEEIASNYIPEKASVLFLKSDKGKTYLNIVPKIKFEVNYGYGSLAQEGSSICGDNYLIKHLSSSKLIAAISDGMGNGYIANQESNATLKLVDQITNTDLTTETSLQILNTFYYIQDYLEKYSTLDFLEINRSTGESTFYKMGASTSYLFHIEGTFDKIENGNLPFGIEEIIETQKYTLRDQDLIIMASDGVFENIINEDDLEIFIKGIVHMDPQKITYEILNYVRKNKVKSQDDMSVIALKILAN